MTEHDQAYREDHAPPPLPRIRRAPLTERDETYHEGSEQDGIRALIVIILGLLAVGVVLFAFSWALAP